MKNIYVFLVSLVLFLIPINSSPLRNWDEAWYAEIIKNMASGNYNLLVPFWNGQYFFDKPPLYFWLSIPVIKIFGEGEWQMRFVSVVSAAFATLLIYLIGKNLFDKKTALISSIIFVSLGQVYVRFSHGNLDGLLTALFLATFYFWLKSLADKKWAYFSGVSLGLGFLVKGWALGLFPVFWITVYSFTVYKKLPKHLFIILLFSLISSFWWYLFGLLKYGREFLNWYIFTPTEGGIGNPLKTFNPAQPIIYVWRDLGVWILPTLYIVYKNKKATNPKVIALLGVASLYILTTGIFNEKLDWHNLPVYPIVSLVVAYGLVRFVPQNKKALIYFVLLVLVQFFVVWRIENTYPDRSKVGALLGVFSSNFVKPGETVVLDDHDFTSFLYYSNLRKVYMLSQEEIKTGEFWRLQYDQLPEFVQNNKQTVVITRDPNKLPLHSNKQSLKRLGRYNSVGFFNGYYFLRF